MLAMPTNARLRALGVPFVVAVMTHNFAFAERRAARRLSDFLAERGGFDEGTFRAAVAAALHGAADSRR